MAGGRVTIKEIAQKAGTSIGTVDRALSNRPGISPKTKALVLQAAQELGYTPNRFASALSRKKQLRLAIISAEKPEGFYSQVNQGIQRAADELVDFGIKVDTIRSDILGPDAQKELLEGLNVSEYDGLAINVAGGHTAKIIDKAIEAGVPVVTYNSDAPDSRRLFYVGHDSRQSGRLGGEILGKMLHGKGRVAIVGNFVNTTTFVDRFGGFCEVLQTQYPGISLYPCAECYSDPERAYDILRDLLQKDPELTGFFSTGYSATVGAIQALRDSDRPDIVNIGYDLSRQTMEGLEEGYCTAILFQDPFRQGYQATRLLARHILEGWLPAEKRLYIETRAVFRYNMEYYAPGTGGEDVFSGIL